MARGRLKRAVEPLALPAAGAVAAALVFLPASSPQASEIARRASAAIQPSGGILYAESSAQSVGTHGEVTDYGTRRVWLHGTSMRRINGDGAEKASANGMTVRIDPKTGEIDRRDGLWISGPGLWNGFVPFSYSYQWLRDGVTIASGATYTLVSADAGRRIACRVTVTNPGGTASATSTDVTISRQLPPPAGTDRLVLRVGNARLAAVLRSGLRLSVTAPRAGRLSVTVVRGKRSAGTASKTIRAKGKSTITIKLSAATRRALAKAKRAQFTVTVRLTTPGRPTLSATRSVTKSR